MKTEYLPPDRGYWYFLRKINNWRVQIPRKIAPRGVQIPRKIAPGGSKFLEKPPPQGGGGADLPGVGIFFLGNIPPGGGGGEFPGKPRKFPGGGGGGGDISRGGKILWYTGPNLAPPPHDIFLDPPLICPTFNLSCD